MLPSHCCWPSLGCSHLPSLLCLAVLVKWVIRELRSTFSPIGLRELALNCWVGILPSFLRVLCLALSQVRRTTEAVNPPQSTPWPHWSSLFRCTYFCSFYSSCFWWLRRSVQGYLSFSRNLRGGEMSFANLVWMGWTGDWMSFSHQATPSRPAGEGGGHRERGVMLE